MHLIIIQIHADCHSGSCEFQCEGANGTGDRNDTAPHCQFSEPHEPTANATKQVRAT